MVSFKKVNLTKSQLATNTDKKNSGKTIGLHHPLDGVTNPEYKLLHFIQLNIFLQREEGTSF
jgi:hypothetical protein